MALVCRAMFLQSRILPPGFAISTPAGIKLVPGFLLQQDLRKLASGCFQFISLAMNIGDAEPGVEA